jgi:hypothetical protein
MRLIDSKLFHTEYIIPVKRSIRRYLFSEAIKDNKGESSRRAFLLSLLPEQ